MHLELSRTCLHYVLAFSFFPIYIFVAENISVSMYIMCVTLCFFSALSRRVGALQISIIIINIVSELPPDSVSGGGGDAEPHGGADQVGEPAAQRDEQARP